MKKVVCWIIAWSLIASVAMAAVPQDTWNNAPEVFAVGMVEDGPLYAPYDTAEAALLGAPSPWVQSLNGTWQFAFAPSPEAARISAAWETITVPRAWELEGYGHAVISAELRPWGSSVQAPLAPMEHNPVGTYQRTFTIPNAWSGREILLCLDGVGGAATISINGTAVGYCENSFGSFRFPITDAVKVGENTLQIQVVRYSDGSNLERMDSVQLSGLYRDVSLVATAAGCAVLPPIETFADGTVTLATDTSDVSYQTALYDASGACVAQGAASLKLDSPSLWTAETPTLYLLLVTTCDAAGNPLQVQSVPIGFRTVDVREDGIYHNGKKLELRGVNYWAMSPDRGYTMTEEELRRDLMLMRDYNINAICVKDGTASPMLLDLCDELGFYVTEEALASTYSDQYGNVDWTKAQLARVANLVQRDRNHPSLLATEVSYPYDFADRLLRTVKTTGEFRVTDQASGEVLNGRGTLAQLDGVQAMRAGELPLGCTLGSPFTVEVRAKLGDQYSQLCSAENFSFAAYGTYVFASLTLADGSEIQVQGDAGNQDNMHRLAVVYDSGELQLFIDNRFVATNRAAGDILPSELTVGGDTVDHAYLSEVRVYARALTLDELLAGNAAPQCAVSFADASFTKDESYSYLGYGGDFGDYPNSGASTATGLFSADREPRPAAEEVRFHYGAMTAEASEPIKPPTPRTVQERVTVERNGDVVTLRGAAFHVTLDEAAGRLREYVYDGVSLLSDPVSPCLMRALTVHDADYAEEYESWWYREDAMPEDVSGIEMPDGSYRMTATYAYEDGSRYAEYYTIFGDGTVAFEGQMDLSETAPHLSMLGVAMNLDPALTELSWTGLGARETYSDLRDSAHYGTFTSAVADQYVDYAKPQECGNHMEARRILLRTKEGAGLAVTSDCGVSFSALPYSRDALYDARHREELAADGVYLTLNAVQSGYFGDVVPRDTYGYAFQFKGVASDADPFLDVARPNTQVSALLVNEEPLRAFVPSVTEYVYAVTDHEVPRVSVQGDATIQYPSRVPGVVTITADHATYKLYVVEAPIYLSDLAWTSATGGRDGLILRDQFYNGEIIRFRGDRWRGEPDKTYEKGLSTMTGSEIVYDVSNYGNHRFSTVIGMDAAAWDLMRQSGTANWMRANANFAIYGDGKLLYERKNYTLRDMPETVSVDISEVKELKLTVTTSEESPLYATWADAMVHVRGAVVLDKEFQNGQICVTLYNPEPTPLQPILMALDDQGGALNGVAAVSSELASGTIGHLVIDRVEEGTDLSLYSDLHGTQIL